MIKETLRTNLERIKQEAEISVREGSTTLILSDKNINSKRMNIPMILSVGAVNSHLVKLGLRGYCSINVETSETLDTHSFAVLIGVGATTINPYLIIDCIKQNMKKNCLINWIFTPVLQIQKIYRKWSFKNYV